MPRLDMFAPEVIKCILEGREPTVQELFRVAEHIRRDVHGSRSAFSWGSSDKPEPHIIRAAHAALHGTD